ncbi:MAG: DnaB helicase C-terminal domain-containing protein [Desulfobulbaceae bacterium]
MEQSEALSFFYLSHLQNIHEEKTYLSADCPFCKKKGWDSTGRLVVYLKTAGFFYGYFHCLNRCVAGGFPLWFARLMGLSPAEVPGYDPDREYFQRKGEYPLVNINNEIRLYQDRLSEEILLRFQEAGIDRAALAELKIGYNGRYLVYPYIQEDGNCYAARCVFPERKEDSFWHGDKHFFADQHHIFNLQDIQRCEDGALFVCQGEENLLALKQLGFPGVAVPDCHSLEMLDPDRLAFVHTVFIVMENSAEAEAAARSAAGRIGYKVRLLRWPTDLARNYNLWQLACDKGKDFKAAVLSMMQASSAFSPFASPGREYGSFLAQLAQESGPAYGDLRSGFPQFDQALEGVHGINVIGGPPKSGKSCFAIQIATEMARRKVPVLYYDFENGRQKIYQRTLSRLSRLSTRAIKEGVTAGATDQGFERACQELQKMLVSFRVVSDRKLNPEIMRRHIDFIRHETRSDYTVVVIDSLHKLPFKDFTEQRTGIDAWLRQLEAIRDELQVSFLILSELSRGSGDGYTDRPHMGMFKGSGDIEYSADNALVLSPDWDPLDSTLSRQRQNKLWLVASREHAPGLVGSYGLDYPYWGFIELDEQV